MSNRTLIELNHDYAPELSSPEFVEALGRYLRCAMRDEARALERFGAKVVGMRHHADKFVVGADTDGFPPLYLKGTASAAGARRAETEGLGPEAARAAREAGDAQPSGDPA